MAFIKHGSPEKLDLVKADTVDAIVCRKCGIVLIRAGAGAMISFEPKDGQGVGMFITCQCGETTNV